jgi:hypothetical protein
MKKRWIVVLSLGKLSDTLKIEKALDIRRSMEGNQYFPSPDPPLAELEAQAVKTNNSYLASRGKGKDKTDEFHHDLDELERMMLREADYVEIVANKFPDIGDTIIHSAGMEFKSQGQRNVQDFTVKNGDVRGTVIARAKAVAPRVSYVWQYVAADGGDFATAAITVKATYTFINLDSGRTYKFRMAVVTKEGQGSWSDELTLVVL